MKEEMCAITDGTGEAADRRRREAEADKARRMEAYEEEIRAVQEMKEETSASTHGAGEAAVRRRREAEAEKAARVEKYEEEIRGLLARKDYEGAAAAQDKIEELSASADGAEEADDRRLPQASTLVTILISKQPAIQAERRLVCVRSLSYSSRGHARPQTLSRCGRCLENWGSCATSNRQSSKSSYSCAAQAC